jgi:hypothetical protein
MPIEGRNHFSSFFVLPFSDEQSRGVREEWARSVDAESEEYLEGKRNSQAS